MNPPPPGGETDSGGGILKSFGTGACYWARITTVIALIVVVPLAIYFVHRLITYKNVYTSTTTATVTSGDMYGNATVTFTDVNGQRFTAYVQTKNRHGNATSSSPVRVYHANEQVVVYYNPSNPMDFTLEEQKLTRGVRNAGIGICISVVLFVVIKTVVVFKNKNACAVIGAFDLVNSAVN